MRTALPLLAVAVYVSVALLVGALLAYPVYAGLRSWWSWFDVAFDSVAHRTIALALFLFLPAYLATAPGSTRRSALGFGCSRRAFANGFAGGFALGLLSAAPLVGALLLLGIRAPAVDAPSAASIAAYLAFALLGAVLIGLVEEAYFRGALLAPLRSLPAWLAVSVVSLLYAGAHFLGGPVTPESVGPLAGLSALRDSRFSLDAFLALFVAGLLLGAMRYRFGHIAVGAGLHAGWVWIIKLSQEYADVDPSSRLLFLHGSLGGTMGYLGLAWIALLGAGWMAFEHWWAKRAMG